MRPLREIPHIPIDERELGLAGECRVSSVSITMLKLQ
jgi:hypothetical protein